MTTATSARSFSDRGPVREWIGALVERAGRWLANIFTREQAVPESSASSSSSSEAKHECVDGSWKSIDELLDDADCALSAWAKDWDRDARNRVARDDRRAFSHFPRFLEAYAGHPQSWIQIDKVDTRFGLPSFAGVIFNINDPRPHWSKACISFLRQHEALPPFVFPTGPGWAYEVKTVWVFDAGKAPVTKWVTIDVEGNIHLTRVLRERSSSIRYRYGGERGVRQVSHWRAEIDDMPISEKSDHRLQNHVAACLSCWKGRIWQWLIVVSDARGRIAFSVPEQDVYRLFATRDLGEGRRRRKALLHWVRYHDRAGGSTVKRHLRGARKLHIRGFDVEVGIPGLHFMNANDASLIDFGTNYATTSKSLAAFLNTPRLIAVSEARARALEKADDERLEVVLHDLRGECHYASPLGEVRAA